jgi:hypothetical protein
VGVIGAVGVAVAEDSDVEVKSGEVIAAGNSVGEGSVSPVQAAHNRPNIRIEKKEIECFMVPSKMKRTKKDRYPTSIIPASYLPLNRAACNSSSLSFIMMQYQPYPLSTVSPCKRRHAYETRLRHIGRRIQICEITTR